MTCTPAYCDIHDYEVRWPWCRAASPLMAKPSEDIYSERIEQRLDSIFTKIEISIKQAQHRPIVPESETPIFDRITNPNETDS